MSPLLRSQVILFFFSQLLLDLTCIVVSDTVSVAYLKFTNDFNIVERQF